MYNLKQTWKTGQELKREQHQNAQNGKKDNEQTFVYLNVKIT